MATTDLTLVIDPEFSGTFVLQRDFQARLLGMFPSELPDDIKMAYLKEQVLALTDEAHEALNETGWKSWATSQHINREAYKGELADVFIFFMNMMMVANLTPSEILDAVRKKIIKNHKRQDDGYDGVSTKCPGCKRAYDDDAVKCYRAKPGAVAYGWCAAPEGWITADGELIA